MAGSSAGALPHRETTGTCVILRRSNKRAAPPTHFRFAHMIDPLLLDILACPDTKQPVKLAEPAVLTRLNALIERGELKNRGGQAVAKRLEAGLLREDGAYLYPIEDGIPIMLIEEAIPVPQP